MGSHVYNSSLGGSRIQVCPGSLRPYHLTFPPKEHSLDPNIKPVPCPDALWSSLLTTGVFRLLIATHLIREVPWMAYRVLGTEPAKLQLGILCYDCLHDLKSFVLFLYWGNLLFLFWDRVSASLDELASENEGWAWTHGLLIFLPPLTSNAEIAEVHHHAWLCLFFYPPIFIR